MIERMMAVSIKNQPAPIHWHEATEIDFVLRGSMVVDLANKKYMVEEGNLIVITGDDIHSIERTSEDLIYVTLHLTLSAFNSYIPLISTVIFRPAANEHDTRSVSLKSEIRNHMSNIVALMEDDDNNIDAEELILYYCLDILNGLKNGFSSLYGEKSDDINERLWKTIDYMYDNYNRKLSIQEVADQIHISPDYLSRLLKKIYGWSYMDLLSQIRAEMSIRLLLDSDMSITAISSECGFSALKYYKAAFIKSYRCTPEEYRESNKANFLLKERRVTADVVYDPEVDRHAAKDILSIYEIEHVEHNVEEIVIDVDLSVLRNNEGLSSSLNYPSAGRLDSGIQKQLSEIRTPYFSPCRNVYIWEDMDTVNLLAFNTDSSVISNFMINLTGLDDTASYLYIRQMTPDYPETLQKLIRQGNIYRLNRKLSDALTQMTFEYGEVVLLDRLTMDMELAENQAARILLQKIG